MSIYITTPDLKNYLVDVLGYDEEQAKDFVKECLEFNSKIEKPLKIKIVNHQKIPF